MLSTLSKKQTQKELSFSVREALPFSFTAHFYCLNSFRFRWTQLFVCLFIAAFQSRLGILLINEQSVGDCIYSDDMVQRVKLAYDSGFQVASHTWSHPHLPSLKKPEEGK